MREFARIEADKVEHFFDARGRAGGVPTFEAGHEADIFRDREMGEETSVLNDVADAAAEAYGIPRTGGAILNQDFSFNNATNGATISPIMYMAKSVTPGTHQAYPAVKKAAINKV